MKRICNLVIVVALLLSVIPAGAMASGMGNGEYAPDWSVTLEGDITVIKPDDYGAMWYVGTDTGRFYHLDSYGNEICYDNVIPHPGVAVSSLVVGDDSIAVCYADGTAYFIDHGTGAVWQSYNSTGWMYDVTLTSPAGGDWYVIASYTGITDKCYITRIDENRVFTSCIGPGLLHGTISASDTALIGALSGSPSTLVSIPVSSLNIACKPYNVAGIPISSLPAYPTLSAYQGYAIVEYTPGTGTAMQHVQVHRSAGTNTYSGNTWHLYLPNIRADYGDIRFYQGDTMCTYYANNPDGGSIDMWVDVDNTANNLVILYGHAGVSPGWLSGFIQDIDSMDYFTVYKRAEGTASMSNGVLTLTGSGAHWGVGASTTFKVSKDKPFSLSFDYSKPSGYNNDLQHRLVVYICDSATVSRDTQYYYTPTGAGQQRIFNNKLVSGSYTPHTIRYYGNGEISINNAAPVSIVGLIGENAEWVTLPDEFNIEFQNHDYSAYPGYFKNIRVEVLPFTETDALSVISTFESEKPVQHNKVVSGTITKTRLTSTHAAVQTSNRLYLQKLTAAGSFYVITDMLERVGTANGLDITDDGTVIIEGRGNSVDIFQHDGTRVGTYNAGLSISDTHISEKNGLYALASSRDTKYYIFSKDESSMWYLLYTSPTGDGITASALSAYGDYFVIARGSTLSVYPITQKEVVEGTITLRIFDRSHPYADSIVAVQRRDSQGVWGSSETFETDGYGTVVISAEYGKLIKIIVGQDIYQTTLIPTPAQAEYVIYIPTDLPLRAGANYRSWYDSVSSRLYYSYFDTRGKTHVATFEIIRNSDNEVVHAETFTLMSGDTGTHTGYYQIPGGYTNTSYRVHLTATGSPSFTNTWHQWISGESGVASLPVELSDTLKIGIFMVLLLFVGGIFSYFSGPHGAVVVSLMAAMLVFWGWLPISPAVVVLCVVWAFLGLLGRTSVG